MTAVAWIAYDTRLLGCPWCRQPVMVPMSVKGSVTCHYRCYPCEREIRVSAAYVKADLITLQDAVPPLVVLTPEQAKDLVEQALATIRARELEEAAGNDVTSPGLAGTSPGPVGGTGL